MENSNQPAYPFVPNLENTNATPEQKYGFTGLTKREFAAIMAMQGVLASTHLNPNKNGVEYAAKIAVIAADELLKQLEQK